MLRELDDAWSVATMLANVGDVAGDMGDLERARSCFRESLIMRRDLADRDGIASILRSLGYLAYRRNDAGHAAPVLAAACTLATQLGTVLESRESAQHELAVGEIQLALGDRTFLASWAAGQTMSLERAIEYELAVVDGW